MLIERLKMQLSNYESQLKKRTQMALDGSVHVEQFHQNLDLMRRDHEKKVEKLQQHPHIKDLRETNKTLRE